MSETSLVRKSVSVKVKSTNYSGSMGDDLDVGQSLHKYQVYRGMSPTTSNRLEIRIRELEGALEAEREGRMRAEKEVTELSFQLEGISERLDEADGLTSAQSEISRKREAELIKVKKEFELLSVQHEATEASLRKKHNDVVADLTQQLEALGRNKHKIEKEKQTLIIEIDSVSTQFDAAMKAKAHGDAKIDGLEDQLRRLKAQVDELTRQNTDLNGLKTRLTQENFELQKQVQDLDASAGALAKAKSALQAQVDELKSRLDDEGRVNNQITIQLNSLQIEYDNLLAKYEEETEGTTGIKAQFTRLQQDFTVLKSKYDKDMAAKSEELDDLRRRLNARIAELEDAAEQARARASKFEKEKTRLSVEIREISVELETANANCQDLARRCKAAEGGHVELTRRIEEMSHELEVLRGDNGRLAAELAKLKALVSDLTDKNDQLARENKQLSEALREAQGANKDLNRQVQDLMSIRIQLEGERDSLANELADARDALKDAMARLEAGNASLNSIRIEMEAKLREKDDEIDNLRKNSARAMDELQRTITEIEMKYKAELGRLKKKFEVEIREYEINIETLNRTNMELGKNNKGLANKVKELEIMLDDERRGGDEARQAVTVLERKRIALTAELEDLRSLLETSERARKNAEGEMHETSTRISELTITITALTGDKRRMEADIAAMQADLDEALNARRNAEERGDRLQAEVNRLTEELRQEQENYKNADGLRKQLEVEIREITVRLEEAESFAQREGKRMVAKLQARLRDLEAELEAEQRRSRELAQANRKLERTLTELRAQSEEDRRMNFELSEQVNSLTIKIKTLRKQLEEAEEVVTITMNKYRKAMSMLEEAESRAETAQRSVSVSSVRRGSGAGGRSMSVTREMVRVVRV